MSRARLGVVILLAALVLWGDDLFAQCAMCRGVLECSLEGRQLARGIGRGILSLLIAPFFLVGTFGVLSYRIRKRAKARKPTGEI